MIEATERDRLWYAPLLEVVVEAEENGTPTIVWLTARMNNGKPVSGRNPAGPVASRLLACVRRGWVERFENGDGAMIWLITDEGREVVESYGRNAREVMPDE